MCIIVIKPKNAEFPTEETLESCWAANPDGAGLMWSRGDCVAIEKGFMRYEDFLKAYKRVKVEVGTDGACVLHFRIATHGEVSPECCHPFPLTGDLEAMRKTKSYPKVGIAHNGIIEGRRTDKRTSDTMDYIANFVYPISRLCDDWWENKHASKLVDEGLDGSRMCVLLADGSVKTFGNFIVEGGCYYSNTSYKGYRWGGYTYGGYAYGDDFALADSLKPFPRICEWCDGYDECRYFGRVCEDEAEAKAVAFEYYTDEEIAAIERGDYDNALPTATTATTTTLSLNLTRE